VAPMKLGVVGKGGVGKTTLAGLLARTYADRGRRVVAIDTDSNPNLGLSLGLSLSETEAVPSLPRKLMTGDGNGDAVADLLDGYATATPAGPTLLSAIEVNKAAAGCNCGGHATVRNLLSAGLAEADVTIVDMEAGLEHLSRSGGTLAYADVLLVVCEPSRKSVVTAERTATLADELGIPHVLAVGNKVRGREDEEFLRSAIAAVGLQLVAVLPHEASITAADMSDVAGPVPVTRGLQAAVDDVVGAVEGLRSSRADRGAAAAETQRPALTVVPED
jgi:CO dehydrogenase maturation factor